MKTKILGGVFALAVMVATGYGVNRSMENNANLSDMVLKNVEALAQFEGGSGWGDCHTNEECTHICNYYDNGLCCPCGM